MYGHNLAQMKLSLVLLFLVLVLQCLLSVGTIIAGITITTIIIMFLNILPIIMCLGII
jgi:hypothetical protein